MNSIVSRAEFLNWLHEIANKEEHIFVLEYGRYLESSQDGKMRKLLQRLIKDSMRHAMMLYEMINEVEKGADDF